MFLDPAIARDFACKLTKTRFILCETLDPFYKEPKIDHSPYNESNDKRDSVKLLTVLSKMLNTAVALSEPDTCKLLLLQI